MLVTSTRDPNVPLTDIQWVMGHARLSTTQLYLNTHVRDVIETMLAFYAARTEHPAAPAEGYRPESLEVLFPKDAK
jgi:site-specific recombinase XerC